jgi:hypothetical protein
LVRKLEGKRPLGRFMHRWEDSIKLYYKEIGWEDLIWLKTGSGEELL